MDAPFVCDACPAPAVVLLPGDDGISSMGILLRRPVPDRAFCLSCAQLAGWPWLRSERDRAPVAGQRELLNMEALG